MKLLAAAVVALGLAGPAGAQTVDASDAGRLMKIIQGLGYGAQLTTDAAGDPMIVGKAEGVEFRVMFYRCTAGTACRVIQFRAGFDLADGSTLEAMNDWNRENLFGSAYLDAEGDPFVDYAVNLDFGVTRANFEDSFDWWLVVLRDFKSHIGFR